jgi:hypothetical protein
MHVLAAARAYKLQGLEQACEQLLYRELGVQNCCEVWPLAVQLGDAGIVTRCIALIRANTRAVVESPSFLTLPPALLEQIVSWEEITIAEVELFTACVKWAQTQVAVQAVLAVQAAQAADAVPERVDSPTPSVMLPNDPFSLPVNSSVAALLAPLLPHLRFPTLSVDALLTTVSPTGVLPDGELLKLVTYAHKPTSTYTLRYIPYKRGRKPGLIVEPVKVELTYSSDFDENGLFFWLGSKGNTVPFSNPSLTGMVRVALSTVGTGLEGHHHRLLSRDRTAILFTDRHSPGNWMHVDLGESVSILPSHITLQHGYLSSSYSLMVHMLTHTHTHTHSHTHTHIHTHTVTHKYSKNTSLVHLG